jgi:hypothetical protein
MLSRTALLFSLLLSSAASAQLVGPGLSWEGTSGSTAGSVIPSCDNFPVNAVVGETVTLTIWGDDNAPFVLLAAATGTQCLPIPNIGNGLILDPPFFPVAAGILPLQEQCRACPKGKLPLEFVVPPVPTGVSAAFQALGLGGGALSFTAAITFTVT